MSVVAAKLANNTGGGSPPSGTVTLGDLAPLAVFSTIGNETAASSTPTAVKMMSVTGYATTATAADTTTLTNVSKGVQRFTGVTTQIVVLPVVTTLPQTGFGYWIINDSSDVVTVNSSGGNLVQTLPAGARVWVFAILLTGTSAASWDTVFTTAASSAGALTGVTSILKGYVASDVTYNDTAALAAVAGMSVDVEAGGIYDIDVAVQSTSAVNPLVIDFGGTATATNFIGQWLAYSASVDWTAPSAGVGARVTSVGEDFYGSSLGGTDAIYTFTGTIEVNAAGTFLLRGAQSVPDASNTVILRGSDMILTKLN